MEDKRSPFEKAQALAMAHAESHTTTNFVPAPGRHGNLIMPVVPCHLGEASKASISRREDGSPAARASKEDS